MKIAPVKDMQTEFNEYVRICQQEPVVVTEDGRVVAVLLAVEDEEELERLLLSHSHHFQTILERGRRQIAEGYGIRHENFWQAIEMEN